MKTLAIFALALTLAAPVVSQAAPSSSDARDVAVRVRTNDLDISKPAGAQAMLTRLDRAAAEACGASEFSLREYRDAVRNSSCYRDSMNRAVASLGSSTVNALYRERAVVVASN